MARRRSTKGDDSEVITPMMRITRARQVAELRNESPPKTWPQVAKATGLSQRTCQRLLEMLRATGDPDAPADAMRWVWERFDTLRVVMDEASNTYAAAPEGSAVRVGALKRIDEASAGILALAADVGFLPRHLRALSAEREIQQVFLDFAELLREHDAPDTLLEGLLELANRRVAQPAAARSLPAA
jgi:hypothetical protein